MTTLREARQRYFDENGFSGDYGGAWVRLRFRVRGREYWVPAFPNSEMRRSAVRLHDLHHVLTGYDTSWIGEAEIGALELASGCRRYVAAWVLNGAAALIGLFLAPRRVARAFAHGRRTRNLYAEEFSDRLLDADLAAMRAQLGLG